MKVGPTTTRLCCFSGKFWSDEVLDSNEVAKTVIPFEKSIPLG
jgi:hypothetical protein